MAKKRCRFLWADREGSYNLQNKTFDGAVAMVAQSKADSYIRPTNYLDVGHRLIDYSDVVLSKSFNTMQLISEKKLSDQDEKSLMSLLNFLVPSLGYLGLLFASLLLYIVALFVLSSFKLSNLQRWRRINNFKSKILWLSFVVCLFLMSLFFSCNLNTMKIVVDVSDILYSKKQLLETKREICFPELNSELNYFIHAVKGSFEEKMYQKANKKDICILLMNNGMGNLLTRKLDSIFLLIPEEGQLAISRGIQTMFRKDTFINSFSFCKTLRAFILRKDMDKQLKSFINVWYV